MGKINKILIIGNSGSGKSTLAKELNNVLNLGYYEIDSYRWNKNWSRVSEDIFENKLTDLTKNKAWIIEDGSKISIEKFKNDADIIIWLKTNVFVCLIRLIKRSLLRWLKKDIKQKPFYDMMNRRFGTKFTKQNFNATIRSYDVCNVFRLKNM